VRATVDTNLLLSYLLSPNPNASSIGAVFGAALAGVFTLLLIEGVADELRLKLAERPDLARISTDDADRFLALLN
jgi:hypothetical protein